MQNTLGVIDRQRSFLEGKLRSVFDLGLLEQELFLDTHLHEDLNSLRRWGNRANHARERINNAITPSDGPGKAEAAFRVSLAFAALTLPRLLFRIGRRVLWYSEVAHERWKFSYHNVGRCKHISGNHCLVAWEQGCACEWVTKTCLLVIEDALKGKRISNTFCHI